MKLVLKQVFSINNTENSISLDEFLLSNIDIAGAIVAKEITKNKIATICVKEFNILNDIKSNEIVEFHAKVVKQGNTSITTEVNVFSNNILCAKATIIYVCIDDNGKSVNI